MPVILNPEQYGLWLDPTRDGTGVKMLLKPFSPYKMKAYPVSGMVNDVKNDAVGCVKEVGL